MDDTLQVGDHYAKPFPTPEIFCIVCDCGADCFVFVVEEAVLDGWSGIIEGETEMETHVGCCPVCTTENTDA